MKINEEKVTHTTTHCIKTVTSQNTIMTRADTMPITSTLHTYIHTYLIHTYIVNAKA